MAMKEKEPPYYDYSMLRVRLSFCSCKFNSLIGKNKKQTLFLIAAKGAPLPKDPSNWSSDLLDMLRLCLQYDQHLRPSAEELLEVFPIGCWKLIPHFFFFDETSIHSLEMNGSRVEKKCLLKLFPTSMRMYLPQLCMIKIFLLQRGENVVQNQTRHPSNQLQRVRLNPSGSFGVGTKIVFVTVLE